jgi:hypothetical protein
MTAVRISASNHLAVIDLMRDREVAARALRAIIEMYKQPARGENELLDSMFEMNRVAKDALAALGEAQ